MEYSCQVIGLIMLALGTIRMCADARDLFRGGGRRTCYQVLQTRTDAK